MELQHSVNLKRLINVPNLCGAQLQIRGHCMVMSKSGWATLYFTTLIWD